MKKQAEIQNLGDVWFKARNCNTKYAALEKPTKKQTDTFEALKDAINKAMVDITEKREAFLKELKNA